MIEKASPASRHILLFLAIIQAWPENYGLSGMPTLLPPPLALLFVFHPLSSSLYSIKPLNVK